MGKVSSTQRKQFKDAVTLILASDNFKFARTLMETLVDKVKELTDQGINQEDIKIQIWIIPKPRKPMDADPANYVTRQTNWFGLDFITLNSIIESAIDPVYDTAFESILIAFYNAIVNIKKINVFYRLLHPKIEPQTEVCEIIIPDNQITR